jgi:hypothetical protein
MKMLERRPGEGRVEWLMRMNTIENLGMAAVLAAGAVIASPGVAAALGVGAAVEGAGAIASKMIHQRIKEKRLRKGH